jgi:hypothetical protein
VKLTVFLLCAGSVSAQLPPKQNVTVALTNIPSAETVREMTTLVKTVGQVPDASYDEAQNSFSLRGFEHQLGLAEWLLHAAEKPAVSNEFVMQPDLPIDNRELVTRVHYLRNSDRGNYQEILTVARVVGEIQLTFGVSQPPVIAFRGTAAQAELGDWLATNLDVPAGTGEKSFNLPMLDNGSEDIVRILYLDPGMSPVAVQKLREKIRLTTNTRQIFDKRSPPAIVIRGNPALFAQVEQIMGTATR